MNKYFFLLLFLVAISDVTSQHVKVVEDRFGIQGRITYSGEISDSLLPEKGRYSLQWRTIDEDTISTFATNGTLKNHRPHGLWTWEEAGWDYTIEPGKKISPVFSMAGLFYGWKGNFKDGVPEGKWQFEEGSSPIVFRKKSPLQIEMQFKDGYCVRDFKIADKRKDKSPVVIHGVCDTEGIAKGEWSFVFFKNNVKVEEVRTYDRGILVGLTKKIGGEIIERDFYPIEQKLAEVGDSNTRVVIGDKIFSDDGVYAISQHYFKEYIFDKFMCGWNLPAFPYTFQRIAPQFKRLAYPISEKENHQREQIEQKTKSVLAKIEHQLKKGNLLINRSRSPELDLAISSSITAKERLQLIDSFMVFSYDPNFIYQDRKYGDLKPHFHQLNAHQTAKGKVYEDQSFFFKRVEVKQDFFLYFELLMALVEDMEVAIKPHLEQLETSFQALNREGELKALEEEISAELVQLDTVYTQKSGIAQKIYKHWINKHLQQALVDYANTDDYNQAKEKGQQIKEKTKTLLLWSDKWKEIDSLNKDLKTAYINYAYNPYTGDYDIELPLKRRFINAVTEHLTPWLINELIAADNWDEFIENFSTLFEVKNQLILFAQMDTRSDRRIERRIRREDQPDKMLRVFTNHMKNRD